MPEILLATLNAKFIHAAFGLRYLMANLGDLQSRAVIREFDINQRPIDIAESLLAEQPRIIGLGVYIWNAAPALELVSILKRLRPDIILVLGGPEVSFETDQQAITRLADYVVCGEADIQFRLLCQQLLSGNPPQSKIIHSPVPDLAQLRLPYGFYNATDVAHRIIYVEASRGCPFTCEFCLSSLDVPVRQFPLDDFLKALQRLMDLGVQHFKFVDRTFNLNLQSSRRILEFFLERYREGLFLHFEMIPDRLPEGLRALIAQFPAGSLQFEVGIQTFDEAVSKNISRRQNYERLADNFRFLRQQTGVHIHADLIAGLPGEDLESFARGFDRLVQLRPQEIQVGILKRLRGTPIVRHDEQWGMVYADSPPYEILANKLIDFSTMQQLRRFSKHWDWIGNSGNFIETLELIWQSCPSPFYAFLDWSEWLYSRTGRNHGVALVRLVEYLFEYLVSRREQLPERIAPILLRDYQRTGRSDVPVRLRPHVSAEPAREIDSPLPGRGKAKRQERHRAITPA